MNPKAIPYIVIAGFCFGSSFVASRFGIGQFTPLNYVGLRLSIAGIGYFCIYLFSKKTWPSLWRHGLVLGLIGTAVPVSCFTFTLLYLSSGLAAIIGAAGPALTIFLASFFLADERLTLGKIGGILLALGGAAMLVLLGETGLPNVTEGDLTGYVLIFIALLCISFSTIYIRKFTQDENPMDVTSIQVFIGASVLLPLSLLIDGFPVALVDWQGVSALFYSGLVGTLGAFLIYFYSAQKFGATAAAVTNYVTPAVSAIAGVIVLGETITGGMILGILIIVAGIGLINLSTHKEDEVVAAD